MKTKIKYKVSLIDDGQQHKGLLEISPEYITFEPFSEKLKTVKEAVYRIVQCGFRKKFYLIPERIYLKTMSGKVLYFKTPKAKEINKIIENLIY